MSWIWLRLITSSAHGRVGVMIMGTTNNTAVIRQLEREVDLLRDKYRTEQSLHAQTERHNAKLSNELEQMQRLYQVAVKERTEGLRRIEASDAGMENVRSLLAEAIENLANIQKNSSLEDKQ